MIIDQQIYCLHLKKNSRKLKNTIINLKNNINNQNTTIDINRKNNMIACLAHFRYLIISNTQTVNNKHLYFFSFIEK